MKTLGVRAVVFLFATGVAIACSIPVFQYALEKWIPEVYPAVIFLKEPLNPEQQAALNLLTQAVTAAHQPVNLVVENIELSGNLSAPARTLYRLASPPTLPALTVFLPYHAYSLNAAEPTVLWSAPLNTETVQRLVDSPVRRQITQRLAHGAAIVWVLLESGDPALDNGAAQCLTNEFAACQQQLELASSNAVSVAGQANPEAQTPRVEFSMVRLSRRDPAEEVFVRTLLQTGDGPDTPPFAPMLFPVFGRGRTLPALVGKDISPTSVMGACFYLTTSCSCEVKWQNPGFDLLMADQWTQPGDGWPAMPLTTALSPLPPRAPLPTPTVSPVAASVAPAKPVPAAPVVLARNGPLIRNVMLAAVSLFLVVVAISAALLRRKI